MALKKEISYQWRVFVPILICFWTVIVAMAFWQVYRVRSLKQDEVFDQLMFVGERVAAFYDNGRAEELVGYFSTFVNEFYEKQNDYEAMIVIVTNPQGKILFNNDSILASKLDLINDAKDRRRVNPENDKIAHQGVTVPTKTLVNDKEEMYKYLYYTTDTRVGNHVYVIIPYRGKVTKLISDDTTKFWLIFFSIAVFGTIFVYISSSFFGRNLRVLRNFANQAAENPEFISESAEYLPHDELGEISRKIITLYNQRVEEMERREREHRVALHAIEEKERVKRDLTSNINHELKTPVGVIQGYIDTLVDHPDMDVETRDRFLYKTQESVHRLTSLIADITAITKLESGGRLINVSPINFHDLVFTFESGLEESDLLQDKLTFRFDVPLDCVILGNDSLLTSVITNFVKNAAAYSKGTECVLEMVSEDENFYKFRFYDDGIGVAPEHLPHMFERFYRVNQGRSRDTGGTGLGLAIVQVTIESLGGKIEVANRYPSGLEFTFTLPKYNGRSKSSAE